MDQEKNISVLTKNIVMNKKMFLINFRISYEEVVTNKSDFSGSCGSQYDSLFNPFTTIQFFYKLLRNIYFYEELTINKYTY